MGKANKQKSSLVKQSHSKNHSRGGGGAKQGGAQGQRPAAFKVSSHKAMKAKHKAKQVTSNLKWINGKSSKEQVNKMDASFSSVHQSLITSSRDASRLDASGSAARKAQTAKKPVARSEEKAQIDMDDAVAQMASL